MAGLQMAQFQRLTATGAPAGAPLKVQYNPGEYTLNKGSQIAEVVIPGLDSPILQFVRGQTETLTLDLFFDTTEAGMGANATPVTKKTDEFYRLIKIDGDLHAPPICLFTWGNEFPGHRTYGAGQGSQSRFGFKCIVESVRQRYTLFSPEGIPLRATLTITLREYKTLAEQIRELNLRSADHTKVHVARQGDTLSHIAWEAYGDPGEWRRIATANSLDDPLDLPPGTILLIPPTD
jgi:nucleoid-associated protein YgaU